MERIFADIFLILLFICTISYKKKRRRARSFRGQTFFPSRGKFSNGVSFFSFQRVSGKCIALHGIPVFPTVYAPLAEFFNFLLRRHHGNILGNAHFIITRIGPYAVRLKLLNIGIFLLRFHFFNFKTTGIRFVVIPVLRLRAYSSYVLYSSGMH